MKWLNDYRMRLVLVGVVAVALLAKAAVSSYSEGVPPIADAGLSRYAAQDPVVLDGTGSYDPDNSGPLSYTWRQIAGLPIVIIDANTVRPMISDFVQTDEIQECEFELVVGDGELTSVPDTVKVIIVPAFTESQMRLENNAFDSHKPTIVYFGGGSASNLGRGGGAWGGDWEGSMLWREKANIISFNHYDADPGSTPQFYAGSKLTFSRCADIIIVYMSAVAPNYKGAIQTMGLSLGGVPAIDVALRLNKIYADARYAVNRVSFLDATTMVLGNSEYAARVSDFLATSVDGEHCWLDAYDSSLGRFYPNALNVSFKKMGTNHALARMWYRESLIRDDMNVFNHGVVAGAYWSVIGPGKNLQLALTPKAQTYTFDWYGNENSGYMDFYDEDEYPGRLPEPFTLVGPVDIGAPDGAILTSEQSENAVGYQLLFGSDSYRVMDYTIISDTPMPPNEIITTLPFEKTWWTVRVRDEYGSTIYADPKPINIVNLSFPIQNISRGKRYGYIQDSIDDAVNGDEIMLSEGNYHENININGKNLILSSTNPNDPATVAATVINGGGQGSVVSLSDGKEAISVLDGLTITGGTVGVSCRAGYLTIRNCTIGSNGPTAIEFWEGYEPRIIDSTVLGYVHDHRLLAHWALDEADGDIASDSANDNEGNVNGEPVWQPEGGIVDGALQLDGIDDYVSTPFVLDPEAGAFSVFVWIKGGAAGQVVISQTSNASGENWLSANPLDGKLMTELKGTGRSGFPQISESVITDGDWHRIGLVRDESYRTLYVDGAEVAKDTEPQQAHLVPSDGGLYIGAGNSLDAGSFFSGLIDDVRIYDVALSAEEIVALAQ